MVLYEKKARTPPETEKWRKGLALKDNRSTHCTGFPDIATRTNPLPHAMPAAAPTRHVAQWHPPPPLSPLPARTTVLYLTRGALAAASSLSRSVTVPLVLAMLSQCAAPRPPRTGTPCAQDSPAEGKTEGGGGTAAATARASTKLRMTLRRL